MPAHGAARPRTLALLAAALASALVSTEASALTLQAPLGGDSFELPSNTVLCGAPPAGWSVDTSRRRLKPPQAAGHEGPASAVIALGALACSTTSAQVITVVATGPLPVIDAQSVTVFLDAGRAELHGEALEGVRLSWSVGSKTGSDVCLNVTKEKGRDVCAVNLDKTLPADPLRITLRWAPARGRTGADVVTYDHAGEVVTDDATRLPVARVILSRVLSPTRTVDVSSGEGRVELVHPEAVSSADCGTARCDVTEAAVMVRAVPAATSSVAVRLRLRPRVFVSRGDAQEATVTESLSVLRCPLELVSGAPLRNVDDSSVLVRLDARCGKDVDGVRWTASSEPAEVKRIESLDDGVYVLLWTGRIATEQLTLVASRADDGSVLAVATTRTLEPPPVRTTLTLPGFGEVEFIPKNRDALLSVPPISSGGSLVPLSTPGAYGVRLEADGPHVRGEPSSGGFAALRFSYRIPSVPKEFAETSFALLIDPVQRPIRDASVPAPLGASSTGPRPIVELRCANRDGKVVSIPPGTSPHIPFAARDSCRLVIHRERIPVESGEQRLDIDISVTTLSGERSEAAVSHHLVLRNGPEPDVIWVRGAEQQFDHIKIRATHVIDESQYMSRSSGKLSLPSAQWTVVTEDAHFKFYATAAIPTSLYRFSNDPQDLGTGPLALNFGVLSRLTWLDHDGREGLVGLEAGVMGMGLATDKDRQLALVSGLGVSVPLGNVNQPTQAAVNIHAWVAYTIGQHRGQVRDDAGSVLRTVDLNPWAFVFGPSITIGNVGTFL